MNKTNYKNFTNEKLLNYGAYIFMSLCASFYIACMHAGATRILLGKFICGLEWTRSLRVH